MYHPSTFHYVGTGLTNLQVGIMPNTQMAWWGGSQKKKKPHKTCDLTVCTDGTIPDMKVQTLVHPKPTVHAHRYTDLSTVI